MDYKRAEEILMNTEGNIDVNYFNTGVWLEGVDALEKTVIVKDLENSKMYKVSAKDLVESE
ncbi:MAG: small, acid-soluble spore protein, H family [Clostridiaceae bacterium]